MQIRAPFAAAAVGALAICFWVAVVARTGLSATCPVSSLPASSSIVRANLNMIGTLLYTYANEHANAFPPELSMLGDWYDEPLNPSVFWNPGDGDPCPTAIDNDEPNAPNSTQVSFRYFGGGADDGRRIVLQDDTLANNAGAGVHALLADSNVHFFRPMASTPPSAIDGQGKLEQIAAALNAYAGDHGGHYPPVLSALFPAYISDPLVFWNSGDTFPGYVTPPVTIDNDTLDAPNSAQTSFAYLGAGRTTSDDPHAILVQDNSPANNGGLVITIRTIGAPAGAYLPNLRCESPVSCRAWALANLRGIGLGMYTYANENADVLPLRLSMLMERNSILSPDTFWNPGDSDPRPLIIDNDLPDHENSTQISYAYFGGNGSLPAAAIVLQDNALENNQGEGLIVLTADGTSEFHQKSTETHSAIEVVQANLAVIGQALHAYAADNGGGFPAQLSLLYPAYVTDPAVFWNPGDTNPLPTTINNDTLNALNSAQISFHYRGAGYTSSSPPGLVLVSDNSLANNVARGMNVLTADGQVGFYAPESPPCTTFDACRWLASAKLNRLLTGLHVYAAEHQGLLPPVLSALYPAYAPRPTDFWDARDIDPPPVIIDNDVPDAPNSAQISYEYLGAGLHIDQIPPSTVLIRNATLANNGGNGILEVHRDSVVYLPIREATAIAISGPDTVTAGATAAYTCIATFDDSTTQDVTASVGWYVVEGQGASRWLALGWWLPGSSERGVYQATPVVATDTPVTLGAVYYGSGWTELVATRTITVQPDSDGDAVPDALDACPNTVPAAAVDASGCPAPLFADTDGDGDVDEQDFAAFADCRSGPDIPAAAQCARFDRDDDLDVDLDDFGDFQRCYSGSCAG